MEKEPTKRKGRPEGTPAEFAAHTNPLNRSLNNFGKLVKAKQEKKEQNQKRFGIKTDELRPEPQTEMERRYPQVPDDVARAAAIEASHRIGELHPSEESEEEHGNAM